LLTERGGLLAELGRATLASADFQSALELAGDDRERAHAWIGTASALRMSDRLGEALSALDRAEQLTPAGADLERAQIYYLRGNLFFPMGRIEECMQQHRQALEHARRIGSGEWEARTIGGMADAYFASGRFVTAHRYFAECVQLARKHGARKVEVANLTMQGAVYSYLMDSPETGMELCREAIDLATRLAQPRPAVVGHHGLALGYLYADDLPSAISHGDAALELAREMDSPRFESESMAFVALCKFKAGERAGLAEVLEKALALAKHSIPYCGPLIFGLLAELATDAGERKKWIREGERVLEAGCIAFNYYYFNLTGMELSLQDGELDQALEFALRMERAFTAEAIPLVQFTVAQGRARVAVARGADDPTLLAELERLQQDAIRARLKIMQTPIDEAIATMRGRIASSARSQ
jgi:tetratricopeptide (TPR) repeat protein